MVKKSYHVIAKSSGKWSVKKSGAEHASKIVSTQAKAVSTAKELVKKSGGGEVIIHEKDGRVIRRDSYGNDPNPPKDLKNSCVRSNLRSVKG